MGCKSSVVREEKRIMDHFLLLVKNDDKTYSIQNYEEIFTNILKNSQNDFKKLEKKQKVRLNFVSDVNKTIFTKEENVRAEFKRKRILFFIVVLTITTKKYIEENILSNASEITKLSSESNLWIDIEQVLFNIVNKLLTKNYNNPLTFLNVFYYVSRLLLELISQTSNLDNFINLEKFIGKIKICLEMISIPEEFTITKNTMINLLGQSFEKTSNISLSTESHKFVINLIFSTIASKADYVMKNEQVKNIFKDDRFYKLKENKSEYSFSENQSFSGVPIDKNFVILRDNIECFYRYIERYTTDVSTGKKIWKQVENFLFEKTNDSYATSMLLEITIIYIFNKTRVRSIIALNSSNTFFPQKGKILLSSIFEYLCDKLYSGTLEHMVIPSPDSINATMGNKHISFDAAEKKQSALVEKNLNLFYEIIYNHSDVILIDQLLTERYMQYFAKIFMEDVLNDTLHTRNYHIEVQEEKLLDRLCDILNHNNEPSKLFVNLLANISKLFNDQAKIHFDNSNEKINADYLNRVLKKLILFMNKFSNSAGNKTKIILDRDELFHIIQNLSVENDEIRLNCIMFFIKFFIFVEYNFVVELEYANRKKIYLLIFEVFYELIANFTNYNNPNMTIEEFMKMIEVLIIMMKNYSKMKFEDAHLIYRLTGMVFKKIGSNPNSKFLANVNVMKSMDSQLGYGKRVLNLVQISMAYVFVCFNMYLISGFYHINNANQNYISVNYELTTNIIKENYPKEILDDLFKAIDLMNLPDTLSTINKKLIAIIDNNPVLTEENLKSITDYINYKYFSKTSVVNVILEHEMQNRNLQSYMREFHNNEMTFRDFSNIKKDAEIFSEHNYSVISGRDIDAIDDMSIIITEDKRSENRGNSIDNLSNTRIIAPFGPDDSFQINKKESSNKIIGFYDNKAALNNLPSFSPIIKPFQISEMDNYLLKNNQVNNIKI